MTKRIYCEEPLPQQVSKTNTTTTWQRNNCMVMQQPYNNNNRLLLCQNILIPINKRKCG